MKIFIQLEYPYKKYIYKYTKKYIYLYLYLYNNNNNNNKYITNTNYVLIKMIWNCVIWKFSSISDSMFILNIKYKNK